MKKISIRIKLTCLSALILTVSCVTLTFVINISANKIINASQILPVQDTIPFVELTPSIQRQNFRLESIIAMVSIIIIGSGITYVAVGKATKNIRLLTKSVKNKQIDNLTNEIPLPISEDEIYDLTLAFNQMSKNLEKSFAIQKQFSADVAHELRTPLALMQTEIEVYQIENNNNFSSSLLLQVERLTNLVNDLLWFSNDRPIDNISLVDITQLINDVVLELSESISEKKVEVSIDDTKFYINGNDALLERVFYNLIKNAIEHNPIGTRVVVGFDMEQKTITISDNGTGIENDEKETVFEPFYKIDKSRSYTKKSTGLGLAICQKILDKHNAKICIKDNNPKGSIFKITFLS